MIQVQLKLRLRPAQERQLERWLFRLTGVWNWAIRKLEADGNVGVRHSVFEMKALVNGHGRKIGVPSKAMTALVAQACDAYDRYRGGLANRPRLKGRRNKLNSIPFDQGQLIRSDRSVYLAGLGLARFHPQEIPAGHSGCSRIVKRASGWYLCLFIQAEREPIAVVVDGLIGVDPGFSNLLTTSDGEIIEHPDELRAGELRVAQAQRGKRERLSARLRERGANRRRDRNHKLSRRLVAENRLIVWSKDNTAGIARSFGKSVSSASHSQLRQMLAYKSRAGGREFVEVASRNSTRICSACRAITGPTGYAGLSVRRWTCVCGATHDRDVNAAVNTLIAGLGMSHERSREVASGIVIESKPTRFMRGASQ